MWAGVAAEGVVAIHFAFTVFVVFGGLLALRWPWVIWLHLPAAIWGALIELVGWVCPLTPLEQALRRRAGQAGYEGGFIEHYVLPVLYPRELTRDVQLMLGTIVIVVNLFVYWLVWRRAQLRARAPAPARDARRA